MHECGFSIEIIYTSVYSDIIYMHWSDLLIFFLVTLVLDQKKRTDMNRQVISKVLFGIFRSSVIRRPTCLKKKRKGEAPFLGQRVPT